METVIKFELERETPNTVRYKEKPERGKLAAVGTIYVQKWLILDDDEKAPQEITVTIEP